jgi:hypothetical protein
MARASMGERGVPKEKSFRSGMSHWRPKSEEPSTRKFDNSNLSLCKPVL